MPPEISTETSTRIRGSAMPPGATRYLGTQVGIELRLVAPQSVEVVEMFAVPKHEIADTVPGGSERMALKAGERRHSEVEPAVALRPAQSISSTNR